MTSTIHKKHNALGLLPRMPQELRHKIIRHHLGAIQPTMGQAQKLQWVVILGRRWLGLEAYRLLLESVTIWNIADADSFMTSCEPTGFLARLFNTDQNGNFTTPFTRVRSLYLAFELSCVDLTVPRPFLQAFPLLLSLFHNLHSFIFTISEYDLNKTFWYITSMGAFPPSLKTVRIISSSTMNLPICPQWHCGFGRHSSDIAHSEFHTIPWCYQYHKFGPSLLSFTAAVKLEIYLEESVDYEDHTAPDSPLMNQLTNSSFDRVSLHFFVNLLRVSPDLRDVRLSNGNIRVKLRRHGAGWKRSVRGDTYEFSSL